jgi:hypothetical protein
MTRRRAVFRYNALADQGVAQPGSAPALGAGGRGFESHLPDQQISYLPFRIRIDDIRTAAWRDPWIYFA